MSTFSSGLSAENKRITILEEAAQAVNGARQENYGNTSDNFETIARYWGNHKGTHFSAQDVAIMMSLVKIARLKTSPFHRDSIVDLAGYAHCLEIVNNNSPVPSIPTTR